MSDAIAHGSASTWTEKPLGLIPERPEWWDRAACRGIGPGLFFPESGDPVEHARRTCRACPAREECLQWALDTHQKYGVWGGLTEKERRRLRSKRPKGGQPAADPAVARRMYLGGARVDDIAYALGVSTQTVRRYLAEAS